MHSRLPLAIIALTCVSATAVPAQDFDNVTVKIIPVAGSIYMLQGAGGNIGLSIGRDDAFMVDDQFAPLTPKIRAAIATLTQKPVKFVLNTHWHGDHTGGNENMKGAGAIIVAQENSRRRMSTEQFIEAFKQKVPASPEGALPVVTFSESMTFYVNDDSVRAIHVRNAHTDGDVLVVFQKANVVHMGDTFFNGRYPLIDVSSGGSVKGTMAAVDRGLAMSNAQTRFIPGHGPLASRDDLIKYRDMLGLVVGRVERLVGRGRTLQQVVAAKPSSEFDAVWGTGTIKPDQFITIMYTDLSRKRK